jgi:hypothetical protein
VLNCSCVAHYFRFMVAILLFWIQDVSAIVGTYSIETGVTENL